MQPKISEISISVYHLIHFTELIDKSFLSYEKLLSLDAFKNNQNAETRRMIFMNISSQILLYTASLQEEYHDHFTANNTISKIEKDKVEQLKEVLKPVFKKINQWNEIKDFRNNVLAHKLRIRNSGYQSVFITRGLSGYNIPERFPDFTFLLFCTNTIKHFVYNVFKEEYHDIEKIFNSDEYAGNPILPERDYKKEGDDLNKEIKLIQRKIADRFQ